MPLCRLPPGSAVLASLRPERDVAADVEAWLAAHPHPRPSGPEALRHVLRLRLAEQGLVRPQPMTARA